MIVRLKGPAGVCMFVYIVRFQFYDSPIKSIFSEVKPVSLVRFQFYDSPIKRFSQAREQFPVRGFQFYDSPIKSTRDVSLLDTTMVSIL